VRVDLGAALALGHLRRRGRAADRLGERAAVVLVVVEAGEQGGVRGVVGLADIGEAVADGRVAREDAVDRRGLDAAEEVRGGGEGEPGDRVLLLSRQTAQKMLKM
tara:strand:+ start:319 stop:633 length:315 start_codon:yes stop_codon:yes gene_type:complete